MVLHVAASHLQPARSSRLACCNALDIISTIPIIAYYHVGKRVLFKAANAAELMIWSFAGMGLV